MKKYELQVPETEISALEDFLKSRSEINNNSEEIKRSSALPAKPQAIVFDFDGVFTNNKVYLDENGKESVCCDRRDGLGIDMLRNTGFPMVVISKEKNKVVAARCKKLKLECYHGIDTKIDLLGKWMEERGFTPENLIYVGNDLNDLECIRHVGCGVAVADALPEVLEAADMILEHEGGNLAVREICDLLRMHLKTGK